MNYYEFSIDCMISKTTEVTKLQVGDATNSIKVVVSTVAEAEHLSDYLADEKGHGKSVNVSKGSYTMSHSSLTTYLTT